MVCIPYLSTIAHLARCSSTSMFLDAPAFRRRCTHTPFLEWARMLLLFCFLCFFFFDELSVAQITLYNTKASLRRLAIFPVTNHAA
jgi:hypothetical protein